jgi:hypothetical protein
MRWTMLNAMIVGLALSATAAPAQATEWMYCGDSDAGVSVGFLLGSVDAFMPSAITMNHGAQTWTSDPVYGQGTPITMGQGFGDASSLTVDLFDDGLSARIAELRLSRAEEGTDVVLAGTLRIPGQGVWAIACDAT